jgi:hypothetical protein
MSEARFPAPQNQIYFCGTDFTGLPHPTSTIFMLKKLVKKYVDICRKYLQKTIYKLTLIDICKNKEEGN